MELGVSVEVLQSLLSNNDNVVIFVFAPPLSYPRKATQIFIESIVITVFGTVFAMVLEKFKFYYLLDIIFDFLNLL